MQMTVKTKNKLGLSCAKLSSRWLQAYSASDLKVEIKAISAQPTEVGVGLSWAELGKTCIIDSQVAEKSTKVFCYTLYYVYQVGLSCMLTYLLTFYSAVGFNTTTTKHPIHIKTLAVTVTIVTFITHIQN